MLRLLRLSTHVWKQGDIGKLKQRRVNLGLFRVDIQPRSVELFIIQFSALFNIKCAGKFDSHGHLATP